MVRYLYLTKSCNGCLYLLCREEEEGRPNMGCPVSGAPEISLLALVLTQTVANPFRDFPARMHSVCRAQYHGYVAMWVEKSE